MAGNLRYEVTINISIHLFPLCLKCHLVSLVTHIMFLPLNVEGTPVGWSLIATEGCAFQARKGTARARFPIFLLRDFSLCCWQLPLDISEHWLEAVLFLHAGSRHLDRDSDSIPCTHCGPCEADTRVLGPDCNCAVFWPLESIYTEYCLVRAVLLIQMTILLFYNTPTCLY